MARFYGSMTNSRGKEVTALNADNSHLRGWSAGVRVWREADDRDRDTFHVVMTGGSNGNSVPVRLGSVVSTDHGPRWSPADVDVDLLLSLEDSEPAETEPAEEYSRPESLEF